jgi:hypothetical protein
MGGKTKSDESINKEDTNDLNRAKSLGKEIEVSTLGRRRELLPEAWSRCWLDGVVDGGSGRRCWFLGRARAGR